jgi:hypothetical protein
MIGKKVRCPNPVCGATIINPLDVLEPAKVSKPAAVTPAHVPSPGRRQDGNQTPKADRPMDIADQLQKLHQLHVRGALSAEEFAKAKQAYLVQMTSKAPAGQAEESPPPLPPRLPNTPPVQDRAAKAPAGQEEFVKTEAVEEEMVETQAVTREGKRKATPPPLPSGPASTPQGHYRAADFKDLYMKFLMAYLTVMSTQLIVFFPSQSIQTMNLVTMIPRLILFTVLSGIFLYRAWAQIQDGRARTTPGKAVGFRFIPIFNFYWEFVAVKGLGEDIEHYARAKRIAINPIAKWLALSYCIMMIVGYILPFVVGFVVGSNAGSTFNQIAATRRFATQLEAQQLLNRLVAEAQQLAGILGFLFSVPGGVLLLILFKKLAGASAAIAEAKLGAVPAAVAVPAQDETVHNAMAIVTAVGVGLAAVGKVIDKGHQ